VAEARQPHTIEQGNKHAAKCPNEALHADQKTAVLRIRALFAGIQAIGGEEGPISDMVDLASLGEAITYDLL
jgi:hypothetical protein